MKPRTTVLMIISFAVLALLLVFFLVIYQPGAGMYIRADKLQDTPEKYVEFNLADLEKYSYVKEAINNPGKNIKLPFDHNENMTEFANIMWDNKTEYIKLNNEYYHISYYSAD
ncbi:hypothetical protein EO98_14395 [Methanosarcina sp. 2.H.T.1A.6]|uniref:hypothetical protein n=1 Tax=unclassified Methanosarcina TaxID=2644672 RepID=UPI0006228A7C|nr:MULTISPECIES: hypothetical protein [unclassified Methanosarcina]KKG18121.1 hypothetical protein EO94_06230 [Methanosarcina sp. 2.H.T.1A.3]KKG20070.1 hypothetical protein EO98_14395 [Methanosarcina sp. 2.H.T.1A.6]KKG22734.1 hypothetical protein EO96_12850 [Methanosarcina sp. 2.H.T.1A.8]KKG25485.1 hypothetical protein EO97_13535 [Methanosarcina sp. 2.H.T.1A.15]